MCTKLLIVFLFVVLLSLLTLGEPILGLFSSRYSSSGSGEYRGRSYNDIARVINPSPYAFPRQSPYPAQPFWTYTG